MVKKKGIKRVFDVSGRKGYQKFLFFLVMIDLVGFGSIIADNFFDINLIAYGEFAWILLFSFAMIMLSDINKLISLGEKSFRSEHFASLVTCIIGIMAFFVAILSLPQINLTSPVIDSVKGIISIIAIVYIILEAWVIQTE